MPARNYNEVNVPMLREIMQVQFAMIETVLYLNTHPRDQRVLELHNDLARQFHQMMREYQEEYGPLVGSCAMANVPWSYINEPWPWNIEY